MLKLPQFIIESSVLTDEDKQRLTELDKLPTELEVDEFRFLPEIQELTNAFIGDDSSRDTHLQLKAKSYIDLGDIKSAWKVILI